ncbi:hypothetical protein ADUPG1_010637, partial [Aduncisulcus paluster]
TSSQPHHSTGTKKEEEEEEEEEQRGGTGGEDGQPIDTSQSSSSSSSPSVMSPEALLSSLQIGKHPQWLIDLSEELTKEAASKGVYFKEYLSSALKTISYDIGKKDLGISEEELGKAKIEVPKSVGKLIKIDSQSDSSSLKIDSSSSVPMWAWDGVWKREMARKQRNSCPISCSSLKKSEEIPITTPTRIIPLRSPEDPRDGSYYHVSEGSLVLALFQDTTSFYPAKVINEPCRDNNYCYGLWFVDLPRLEIVDVFCKYVVPFPSWIEGIIKPDFFDKAH